MKASPIYVQSSLGLLSIAMTASLGGCRTSQAATRPESALAPGEVVLTPQQMRDGNVRLGPVAERDLEDSIRTSGRVALDDLRSAHVFSPVTGRVVKITAQLGQQVHKGQSLAIIESPDIGSAVSDVHKARADVIASEHDWSRKKQLFEQNAASEVDLEIAEDTWRKSKTELERARQKQALLRIGDLDTVTQMYSLTSPIDRGILRSGTSIRALRCRANTAGVPIRSFSP